jgi:hypothetical protein
LSGNYPPNEGALLAQSQPVAKFMIAQHALPAKNVFENGASGVTE